MPEHTKEMIIGIAWLAAVEVGLPDPGLFVRQIGWESGGFQAWPVNEASGCYGPAQLNPRFFPMEEFDTPEKNIRQGARLMKAWLDRYAGDYEKALVAYNWGPGNLDKLLNIYPASWRMHLPAQPRKYLQKILGDAK